MTPDTPTPKPKPDLILATDLDGTFAGGTRSDRERLQGTLAARRDALLVYVTGRSVPATLELIESAPLPRPHLLIADVGTTVVRGDTLEGVAPVEAEIESAWPGADAVRQRLARVPGIEEQDLRPPRRVSYWLRDGAMEAVMEAMAARLHGLSVDLVGSAGVYIDVLPGGVNKGTTLFRVLRWLDADDAAVVVAGDTLNDLALMETGLRGIVVGNCEPALRARVEGRPHLYFAHGEGAAGVLEGLLHFGCVEGSGHGE